jgi:predicted ArsR family transcriptional regulator
VLGALLEALAERLPPDELDELLRDAGRRLTPQPTKATSLEARVQSAGALLAALGGELDVERTPKGFMLRGYACPLSAAVRANPKACHAVEELVSAVVGAPVRECCDRRDGGARCRFEVLAHSA